MTNVPPTPKARRTRARILAAAQVVFERKGLHAARITDIAEESGLSPSAFYRYFDSKAEVLEAVALSSFDAVFEAVGAQDAVERSLTPAERFRLANRRYLAAYCDNALGIRLLEQYVATNPLFREHRRGINQRFIPRLGAVFGQMMEAGQIDDRYDPRSLSEALSAMVDRSAYINFVLRGHRLVPEGLTETIDILWDNVLGLASPEWVPTMQIVAAPYPWMYARDSGREVASARGMNTQELLEQAATKVFAERGFLGSRM
ncbi:TetR/AcrR family transcriptional regulator, partial [Ilumatobacter sp.]|uniref:TetR/AcrR family transcriptional regulator n=1 Tax=Ilumatobacter sp. TaxID=1967498 RepID=UPI003752FF85